MSLQAIFTTGIDEITVTGLSQWDTGRTLQIQMDSMPAAFQVHFAFKKSKEALITCPTITDDKAVVEIPNALLQQPYDLTAWIYALGAEKNETVATIFLPTKKRPKPVDYKEEVDETLAKQIERMVADIAEQVNHLQSQMSTVTYDTETKTLNICSGGGYN